MVILLGHIGKDPEIRTSAGGMTIASLSLATSDRKKDAQGEWQDTATWHNLVAFDKVAEIIRDYCHKGDKLFVEGKIQTRSWDDKDSGEKKYRTEILVNQVTLLGGKPAGEGAAPKYDGYGRATPVAQSTGGGYGGAPAGYDQGIEDVPFICGMDKVDSR
jgi:single-strand DNA-binding protein